MRRLLVAALLLGACAASPRRAGPPPIAPAEPADLEQLNVELRNRVLEFRNRALELRNQRSEDVPTVNCPGLKQLRDSICTLADRICRIADKQAPGSPAADYCSDGKERCAHATESLKGLTCGPFQPQ